MCRNVAFVIYCEKHQQFHVIRNDDALNTVTAKGKYEEKTQQREFIGTVSIIQHEAAG